MLKRNGLLQWCKLTGIRSLIERGKFKVLNAALRSFKDLHQEWFLLRKASEPLRVESNSFWDQLTCPSPTWSLECQRWDGGWNWRRWQKHDASRQNVDHSVAAGQGDTGARIQIHLIRASGLISDSRCPDIYLRSLFINPTPMATKNYLFLVIA